MSENFGDKIHTAIRDHEKAHGCKVASMGVDAEGNIGEITCVPWPTVGNYMVSVYNCHATLCREIQQPDYSTRYIPVPIPGKLERQVEAVLHCNVEDQGGAINWSGHYPLLHKWATKLRKLGAIPA